MKINLGDGIKIMKERKIGFYDYTVVLTYLGMICAYVGITKVINASYRDALLCLMLAGVCDMFDGAVASTKERGKREQRFGIQIDSLSDLISFGVLPALFVYGISEHDIYSGIVGAIFILCALIRLAFFNVLEEERQSEHPDAPKRYLGVPVTVIAGFLPIEYIIYDAGVFKNTMYFVIFLFIVAIGFISPVEIKKPGLAGKICIVIVGIGELVFLLLGTGLTVL